MLKNLYNKTDISELEIKLSYEFKDKSLLLVPHNTKLTDANTELISGIFSKTNGVFQIKESNQILQEIQIKPCFFIEFLNLKEYEKLSRRFMG